MCLEVKPTIWSLYQWLELHNNSSTSLLHFNGQIFRFGLRIGPYLRLTEIIQIVCFWLIGI